MFPWVYGFSWDAGNVIFLGIFFMVIVVITGTFALAAVRAYRDQRMRKHESIKWHQDFHDLPQAARTCRHVLNGELRGRDCPNGFDCRGCELHQQIEQRSDADAPVGNRKNGSRPDLVAGFQMPLDRLYHRGHSWVRMEADGTATVGLDDFAARMFGKPEKVDLPPVGTHLHVNRPGWKMRRKGAVVRVLSPVDGSVLATGGPAQGWYLRVRPLTSSLDTRHLLHGEEVYCWIANEMKRVGHFLRNTKGVPTLADGGEPLADIPVSSPDADWDGIWGEVFLEP